MALPAVGVVGTWVQTGLVKLLLMAGEWRSLRVDYKRGAAAVR